MGERYIKDIVSDRKWYMYRDYIELDIKLKMLYWEN